MSAPHPNGAPDGPVFRKVGENLYRLESTGALYALLKHRGKQIRKSLRTHDRALAKRRLEELRAKVARLQVTPESKNLSFDALADRWFSTVRGNLKPKSASRIDVCLKGLRPYFRNTSVRNIRSTECENWKIGRGDQLSPQSYKHERRVLIAVLDYALKAGLLLDNPATSIPTRKLRATKKMVIPTREQFRTLVETIRQADVRAQHAGNLVELLGYSGMRLNEALSLTWGDVDFDGGSFLVTGGTQGTKSGELRTVPLFPALRELLERIRGDRQPELTEQVVPLTGRNGATTAIRTATRKAGLPRFLHHSLRHYFCSNAIELGIDFKAIAGWLGHRDGGFLVAKTYGHLRKDHSYEMAKRMTLSATQAPPGNVVPAPIAAHA